MNIQLFYINHFALHLLPDGNHFPVAITLIKAKV